MNAKNETMEIAAQNAASELDHKPASVGAAVFVALALWLGLILFLGAQGAFAGRADSPPLPIFFGFAIPLVVFLAAYFGWSEFRTFILGADLRFVAAIE